MVWSVSNSWKVSDDEVFAVVINLVDRARGAGAAGDELRTRLTAARRPSELKFLTKLHGCT
jgi:hypothetical protein